MATKKIQTGIRFTSELLDKMTYIAKLNHRSFNSQMEFIAYRFVEQFELLNGEITEDDIWK